VLVNSLLEIGIENIVEADDEVLFFSALRIEMLGQGINTGR
jgi:hypothetical protein